MLLLRGLVAFIVVTQLAGSSGWLITVVVLATASLLFGFMTPLVAVGTALISFGLAFSNFELIELVVLTAALALLGPGAYSIDARLFGRREVFIPRRVNALPVAPDRPDR